VNEVLSEPTSGCWYGGIVIGAWNENGTGVNRLNDGQKVTWDTPYHHSGGITTELHNFLIEDISVVSHGDGIRTNVYMTIA